MDHIWSPWRMVYIQSHNKEPGCVFCNELNRGDDLESLIVFRGPRAFVILNRYPYTSGHLMIVPYVHAATLEELDADTRLEIMDLLAQSVEVLEEVYHPQGYNAGLNLGEAAGAGITGHIHFHVVPRWVGDTNFMSSLGATRVLPESLEDTCRRVSQAWANRA
jgi:ATP adenylyltransferase